MKLVLFFLVMLLMLEQTAAARDNQVQVPAVVVTGSRIPYQGIDDDSSTVVLDRETINRLNPVSVAQLLQGIPGIYVENSGSRGSISAVYMRGAEPNYTLVLVDGVSVNDPTNSRGGTFDFSLLNIDDVERIEIVKGPASSVYGSAAMAGVINIITRKVPDNESVSYKLEAGTRGLRKLSALAGMVGEQGEISLSASREDAGEQIDGRTFKASSVGLSGVLDITGNTELIFTSRYHDSDAETFPDASGGAEYAVLRELDQRKNKVHQAEIKMLHDHDGGRQWEISASQFRTEEEFWSPGVDSWIPENQSDSTYERKNILAAYRFEMLPNVSSVAGIELSKEQGDAEGLLDFGVFTVPTEFELERDSRAVFLEGRYTVNDNAEWSAGVRMDKPEGFAESASPHLAYSSQLGPVHYRLSWGKGFKLPSFFALGHNLVGNPDFKTEKNETVELYLKYSVSPSVAFDLASFNSISHDLIDFDDSGVLVSRDEVAIKGFDANMQGILSDTVQVNAYLSLVDMDIKDSTDVLYKRPERSAGLGLSWQVTSPVSVFLKSGFVGAVRDFSYPTGEVELEAYLRTDVAINWDIVKGMHASLAIDNVLGEKYQEAVGFETSAAAYRIAVHGSM